MKVLLTSDWHLRNDNPINRIDDFQQIQIDSLKFIANIAQENDAVILIAGDIFHKSKQENMQELINQVYNIFECSEVYFIAGNHDLLYKSMENFDKCNIGIVNNFNNWDNKNKTDCFHGEEGGCQWFLKDGTSISLFNFNDEIENNNGICVMHKYCEIDNLPEFISDGITAKYLLEKYPNFEVFHIGDNHQAFECKKDGRFVFNTGCLTRQNLNEKDYQPSIILFDIDTKTYEKISLPDQQKGVFKEENLTKQMERENRLDSFIDLVGSGKKVSFSFESNLNQYCKENKIDQEIINEIEGVL